MDDGGDDQSIERRLARLEERLSRLEKRLAAERAEPEPPLRHVAVPPPVPPPLPRWTPIKTRALETPPEQPAPTSFDEFTPSIRPAIPVYERASAGSLEAQVGLKWAGWVGAIIVVIGAALGIKFAYDNHWFGKLSPATQLALMSLGGFALVAAGEVVYRRISRIASAGPFGAGVAVLFVVSYAGYDFLHVYQRDTAFVFMALVTLIGSAVAIRANLVSIGVLAIVGGNIAPLALGGSRDEVLPLLTYLLMLQIVALVLAYWGQTPKWWTLRGVSLATICLWLAVSIANVDDLSAANRQIVLVFSLIYATLFHAELILSSIRGLKISTTREPGFAVPVPLGERDFLETQRGLGVTFSLLVTAAVTIAVLVLRWDHSDLERGLWTIGLGACCLLLGMFLPKLTRSRDVLAPPSPISGLSIGYRIQAAALLVVAVPVTLSGVWVTTAWAILAIAFALAGVWLNLSVSRIAAVVVWLLAVMHLATWTFGVGIARGGGGPMATWVVILGTAIPAYMVLAAVMTLVGHAISELMRQDWTAVAVARQALADEFVAATPASSSETQDAPHNLNYESPATKLPTPFSSAAFQSLAATTDVLAAIVFVVAAFAALPVIGVTFAALCYGWVLIGGGQVLRSPQLQPLGVLLVMLSAGKWMLYDTFGQRFSSGRSASSVSSYRPLYNPAAAVGAAIFLSGLGLLRIPLRLRDERSVGPLRAVGGFGAVLVLLWLVTLEIDRYFQVRIAASVAAGVEAARAEQVAISIFWSIYAIGCVVLGFAIRIAGLRYFGLTLFALTVLKVVLVDLSSVAAGYRILSFLGLGLLLLGTSVLYGKLSPLLLREPERNGPQAQRID